MTFETQDDFKGYTLSKAEKKLMKLKAGHKIGDTLSKCTICPTGHGSCVDFFTISPAGFHPDKGIRQCNIMICPFGIQDSDSCPLVQ